MAAFPYTLDDFDEAIKASTLTVVAGDYYLPRQNCGCPLTILAAHKGAQLYDDFDSTEIRDVLGLDDVQVLAFCDGFDGDDGRRWYAFSDATECFDLGRAARHRFLVTVDTDVDGE